VVEAEVEEDHKASNLFKYKIKKIVDVYAGIMDKGAKDGRVKINFNERNLG
jgi:hypothetical protein